MGAMSYKVTLEVYVNEQSTLPRILVESQNMAFANEARISFDASESTADTAALEDALTKIREFAETLSSGVREEVVT